MMPDRAMEETGEYLSTKEVAELIGYSERQVRELAADWKWPGARKVGRKWLIPRQEVMGRGEPEPSEEPESPGASATGQGLPATIHVVDTPQLVQDPVPTGHPWPAIEATIQIQLRWPVVTVRDLLMRDVDNGQSGKSH